MDRVKQAAGVWALIVAGMAVIVPAAPCGAAESAAPPNVVLIISDDQAWTDYGFMGHPTIQTPHIDRLAREGLVYTRGYVPSSLCRPSLATMITGRYAHHHTITGNDPPWPAGQQGKWAAAAKDAAFQAQRDEMVAIFQRTPALPRLLGAHGYVSFQSGKWWEGPPASGGFTAGMSHGDRRRGGRHGDEGLKVGRETMQPVFDFLDHNAQKPFFLWYAPMLPHEPHNPPERLLKKYQARTASLHVARYWAMCEWFDETIGQLLDKLQALGLTEKTLVIYLADNGWIQDPQANGSIRSKRTQYDAGLRTPIVLCWPGRVPPARNERAAVESIDLAPTILAACGLPVPPEMPGVNLLDAAAVAARPRIMGEIFTHNAVELERPAANLMYRWVIDGFDKLIVPAAANVPDGTVELYNLQNDPTEQKNLAAQQPQRVHQLQAQLDAWWPGR